MGGCGIFWYLVRTVFFVTVWYGRVPVWSDMWYSFFCMVWYGMVWYIKDADRQTDSKMEIHLDGSDSPCLAHIMEPRI